MQPKSTKATVQASLQPASTAKYLSSDKVKRMGSARPLNAKKDSLAGNDSKSGLQQNSPAVGPQSQGN